MDSSSMRPRKLESKESKLQRIEEVVEVQKQPQRKEIAIKETEIEPEEKPTTKNN